MIAIVKYNAGNIRSVQNALLRLNRESVVTDDPDVLQKADHVIFPGVGAAGPAMKYLKKKGLDKVLPELKQPFLGVCLGLQIMCTYSEEGDTQGLDIFPVKVRKFPQQLMVPHMGWNELTDLQGPLFNGIESNTDFYFVHSYFAETNGTTAAMCNYGLPFSAALQRDNFYAVQFHPEKSAEAGLQLLKNFLNLPSR